MDAKGVPKLVDFGVADDGKRVRAWTVAAMPV